MVAFPLVLLAIPQRIEQRPNSSCQRTFCSIPALSTVYRIKLFRRLKGTFRLAKGLGWCGGGLEDANGVIGAVRPASPPAPSYSGKALTVPGRVRNQRW